MHSDSHVTSSTDRCPGVHDAALHYRRLWRGAPPTDKRWMRDILRLIKAHDAGRITPQPVAAALANLNHRVAGVEPTVGRRCIVAWRFQKGGGAQEFFDGGQREISSSFVWLPINAHGMDVTSLLKVMAPFTITRLDALRRGEAIEMDTEAINTELAKLPDTPDDKLA